MRHCRIIFCAQHIKLSCQPSFLFAFCFHICAHMRRAARPLGLLASGQLLRRRCYSISPPGAERNLRFLSDSPPASRGGLLRNISFLWGLCPQTPGTLRGRCIDIRSFAGARMEVRAHESSCPQSFFPRRSSSVRT